MRWLSILLLLTLPFAALASDTAPTHACAPEGIAMGGYDLVSYHHEGGPIAGSQEFKGQRAGLTYLFSSDKNLKLFLAKPATYLPRYQGWCAATLSMGRLACPDYTNFKIEDGQLLLFELAGFTNGRTLWNSDPAGFKTRADANAQRLLN
jgi:YHS domain-containing protein